MISNCQRSSFYQNHDSKLMILLLVLGSAFMHLWQKNCERQTSPCRLATLLGYIYTLRLRLSCFTLLPPSSDEVSLIALKLYLGQWCMLSHRHASDFINTHVHWKNQGVWEQNHNNYTLTSHTWAIKLMAISKSNLTVNSMRPELSCMSQTS